MKKILKQVAKEISAKTKNSMYRQLQETCKIVI